MGVMDFLFGSTPEGMVKGGVQGLVEGVGNSVDKIIRDLKLPPEVQSAAEVRLAELKAQTDLAVIQLKNQTETSYKDEMAIVNTTMQAELHADHFLQWSWRPLNGYALAIGSLVSVGFVIFAGYQAVVLHNVEALNALPQILTAVALVLSIPGAVCGVTAWHRGIAQIEQIKKL